MTKGTLPAHIALLSVNALYGANYVIAKGLMPDVIGPSGFIMLRVIGATLLFWTIYSFNQERVANKDLLRIAICAVFGVAANQLLFFNGLNLTSPMNSSIIMTTNPILVLVIAAFVLKEGVTIRRGLGILLGFLGAATIIYLSSGDASGLSSPKGDLMIFLNSLSYALYLVLVKPIMKRYKPLTVISWVFLFGLLYVVPFGWAEFMEVDWGGLSQRDGFSMVYVVVGVTFLAYLLNLFALQRVSPNVVSSYIYLQPILAGFFTWLFFITGTFDNITPHFTWAMGFATLAIFIGVWLVSSKRVSQK